MNLPFWKLEDSRMKKKSSKVFNHKKLDDGHLNGDISKLAYFTTNDTDTFLANLMANILIRSWLKLRLTNNGDMNKSIVYAYRLQHTDESTFCASLSLMSPLLQEFWNTLYTDSSSAQFLFHTNIMFLCVAYNHNIIILMQRKLRIFVLSGLSTEVTSVSRSQLVPEMQSLSADIARSSAELILSFHYHERKEVIYLAFINVGS